MKKKRYRIRLPAKESIHLPSDVVSFQLDEDAGVVELKLHDYGEIYKRPGLYEQLFYDRLKCASPEKVCEVLVKVLNTERIEMSSLRVLDLGAGNGMVGERLSAAGVSRVVGVDIDPEAQVACERDRPGIYDAYYVEDLCKPSLALDTEMQEWRIDCMTCVAALGFGDIPIEAFKNAFNYVKHDGWVIFNIKETFLHESDTSGFSRLIKKLLLLDTLEIHHMERYCHRISVDGAPLHYFVIAGKKQSAISDAMTAEDAAVHDETLQAAATSAHTQTKAYLFSENLSSTH